nr:DEAD/DEAH box helicase [Pilimelia anulata]
MTPTEAQLGAVAEPAAAPADFAALGLPRRLVRALAGEGIDRPFPIQAATIPDALVGRDVLGRGQTGSGKTLAFGLPLLARLATFGRSLPNRPFGLVLVPTRELAFQVADALRPLARQLGVYVTTLIGGVPYDRQVAALEHGVHLVVATPGRLGDLAERGACELDRIEITVLDEADQMADMGFLPDVTKLLERTPAVGQRLLFSATLDGDVDALVQRFMVDPVTHSLDPATAAVDTMDHHLFVIPPQEKFAVTASIAARHGRTILFARTQAAVDRLVGQLAEVGVTAGALHGGKTQRMRTRTLAEFREGRTSVLVATDVAARGIHVDGVSLVLHVDPPRDPKDYLHRAGRTARAGEAGAVATLVLPKQRASTLRMMTTAGVAPTETKVRPGDAALATITGARPRPAARTSAAAAADRDGRTGGDRAGGAPRGERNGRPERDGRPDRAGRGQRPGRAERAQAGDRANAGAGGWRGGHRAERADVRPGADATRDAAAGRRGRDAGGRRPRHRAGAHPVGRG